MAKTQSEDDKKHGDKLESLIERTGGGPSPKKRVTKDDPAQLQVDDQDVEDDDVEDDDADDERTTTSRTTTPTKTTTTTMSRIATTSVGKTESRPPARQGICELRDRSAGLVGRRFQRGARHRGGET